MRRAVASAMLLGALEASSLSAQTFDAQTEGLPVGRFLVHPSLTFEYTHDSNALYVSSDLQSAQEASSGIFVVKPRVLVDLPLGQNRIRWTYSPMYRRYTNDAVAKNVPLSHNFDLESTFVLGPSLHLTLRDHFFRGTIELREVDPGGELTFGLVPFSVHEPEFDITADLGARHGVSLIPRYSSTDFANPESASFFNYTRREIEGRYNYRLSEPSTMYAFYALSDTIQDRQVAFFGDISLSTRRTGLGLRRTVNQAVVTEMSAGYETIRFRGGLGRDFSGPVVRVDATWQPSDASRLDLSLLRQPYQSFYANNNYFLDERVGLRLLRQVGPRAYLQIGGGVRWNNYADPLDISVGPKTPPGNDVDGNGQIDAFESLAASIGTRRKDRVRELELGIGYRFLPTLRGYIGYNFERRSSNIEQLISGELVDPFHYEVNRLVFRIEAGWL